MGRLFKPWFALATATLGSAGCLLFTDPINEAPVVTIGLPKGDFFRGAHADLGATVADDRDDPFTIRVQWAKFPSRDDGCTWITAANWVGLSSPESQPRSWNSLYDFYELTLDTVCVCVLATDHDGATGRDCRRIKPKNPEPVATITEKGGAASGASFPLCSRLHLTAEPPQFMGVDTIKFNWAGTNASGTPLQFIPCTDGAASSSDTTRCFNAGAPGEYAVTLTIDDTVKTTDGASETSRSKPAVFVASVLKNAPACIRRSEPDVYAQRVLLSRNTDLARSYQEKQFTVLGVDDDCESVPGSGDHSMQYVWRVYDSTQSRPEWKRLSSTSRSLTLSQTMFPKALPGDTVKLRVEVRDSNTPPSDTTCSLDQDRCCASGACLGAGDCVRATTWTVQFQP